MNDFQISSACNPYGLLACKIVEQAILDWRALIRGKTAGATSSLEEIKHFLLGQWCEDLLSFTDVDGEWVLERLLKEEDRVCQTRKMATVAGRTENLHVWCNELGLSKTAVYKAYLEQGREYVERRLTSIVTGCAL